MEGIIYTDHLSPDYSFFFGAIDSVSFPRIPRLKSNTVNAVEIINQCNKFGKY